MNYWVTDRCIKKLHEFEGFRAKPYQDGGGKWTRGYGELCQADSKPVTVEQAEAFVIQRLKNICTWLTSALPGLMQHQVDAICIFLYNVGPGGFRSTETFQLLFERKPEALMWWLRWTHDSKGNVEQGLVTRRRFEVALFCYGWH